MSDSHAALPWHHHQAFGLRLRACLPLPELQPGDAGAHDVEIVYGAVPAELPEVIERGVRYQAAAGQLMLVIDGIARFLVDGGTRIVIERFPDSQDDDIRLFLLGSALGALLHQRQDLVLHASAVDFEGQAVAFMGVSGIGKSTLAMAFHRRGYPVLTDDLCVIRDGLEGRMDAYPGFPQAKLWLDSLRQLEVSPDGLRRIRNKLEKRALPLVGAFVAQPLPIRRLYLLRAVNKDEIALNPVQGPQKFSILKNNTYRFRFVAGMEAKSGHFQKAMKVAQQASLSIVTRPRDTFRLDDLVARLEADFRS